MDDGRWTMDDGRWTNQLLSSFVFRPSSGNERLLPLTYCREVLHQQPVDEDVAAADFAEEDALGAVVEEGDEAEGQGAVAVEKVAQS